MHICSPSFILPFPTFRALLEGVCLLLQHTQSKKKAKVDIFFKGKGKCLSRLGVLSVNTLISNSTVAQSLCPHANRIKLILKYLLTTERTVLFPKLASSCVSSGSEMAEKAISVKVSVEILHKESENCMAYLNNADLAADTQWRCYFIY